MSKREWYMAAAYVGAIVGAGFASGQETLSFFVTYGIAGLLGIMVVTIGFTGMGALHFVLAQEMGVESYRQLLEAIAGRSWSKYYDVIITCFLLAGVGVMLAGAGALVYQQWGFPQLMGILVTALIAGASCGLGIEGVFLLNALLVPGIILATAALGLAGLGDLWPRLWEMDNRVFWGVAPSPLVPNWWLAATIYISYNSLLGIAACTPLAASLPQRRMAVWGGAAGGLALGLLLLGGGLAIWAMGPETTRSAVPMAWIATSTHSLAGGLYGIVIWSAMVTTAATNLFAVLKRLQRSPSLTTLGILLLLAFGLSLIGFSALIELLYPVFGYLGCSYVLKSMVFFWKRWGAKITNRSPRR
ncbi:MAG: hypothetical protein GX998_10990 [Firmicutes bacterium]|nr:hypothetical protein [Bacillota bacterium]